MFLGSAVLEEEWARLKNTRLQFTEKRDPGTETTGEVAYYNFTAITPSCGLPRRLWNLSRIDISDAFRDGRSPSTEVNLFGVA